MGSFHDVLAKARQRSGIRPEESPEKELVETEEAELAMMVGPVLYESLTGSSVSKPALYCVRLRNLDTVVFCRAEMMGEWVWLLGAVVTDASGAHIAVAPPCSTPHKTDGRQPASVCRPGSGHLDTMAGAGFRSGVWVRLSDIVWQAREGEDKPVETPSPHSLDWHGECDNCGRSWTPDNIVGVMAFGLVEENRAPINQTHDRLAIGRCRDCQCLVYYAGGAL